MRIAHRWQADDLALFQRERRRMYQEARVTLRAVRGCIDPIRTLHLLVLACAQRQVARRYLVRERACRVVVQSKDGVPVPSTAYQAALGAYVDMMNKVYAGVDDGR